MVGDEVAVSFTESESGHNKYTGKPFINRRILSFEQVENTPVTSNQVTSNATHPSQQNNSYESIPTINIDGYSPGAPKNNNDSAVNESIKESIKELREEIRILSGRVSTLESKNLDANNTDVEITEIPF